MFAGGFAVGRYTNILQPVATEETPYTFVEPLIEKAARLMLNKNDTEPILRGELKNITRLYVAGQEAAATTEEWDNIKSKLFKENKPFGTITRLDDVALMENLQSLNLYAQSALNDISPLAGLQRLEHADITHCNIEDASPLVNLPRLTNLNLFDNVITDFSCFGRMEALTHLGVGKMTLRRISELGEVLHVESLDLRGTQIESLDGIENFHQLAYLMIPETAVRDFSPLDSLQNLKELWISADMEQYSGTLKNVKIVIN